MALMVLPNMNYVLPLEKDAATVRILLSVPTRSRWQVPGSSARWPHPRVSPHLTVRGHEVDFAQLLCPLMHKLQEQLQVVFHGGIWGLEFGGSTFYSHAGKTSRPLQPLHMFVPGGGGLFLFAVCLRIYIPTQDIIPACVCLSVSFLPTLDTSPTSLTHFISL